MKYPGSRSRGRVVEVILFTQMGSAVALQDGSLCQIRRDANPGVLEDK